MSTTESLILVLTTVSTESSANEISQKLLEDGLAACIQVEEKVRSHYRWQGKLIIENECRLAIKSIDSRWKSLRKSLEECHPYEIPEIIKVNIDDCSDDYRRWIISQMTQANI